MGFAASPPTAQDQPPRRDRAPLAPAPEVATLKRWLRHWSAVRHRDGAERTLLAAIAAGAPQDALADLLLAAETDRVFADGGHSLDFINKAFECLDLIGFEHAAEVLPTVVGQMVAARGRDETTAWRQPVDLVALLERACAELPALFAAGRGKGPWRDHAALAQAVLGDDPAAIVAALKDAIRDGAAPHDLGRAVAYAAALRVARFGTANEFGDWETAHHSFTYCNAVHQALKRLARRAEASYVEAVRGVFHGAMTVYLDRYLNIPPARLPGEDGDRLDDLPRDRGRDPPCPARGVRPPAAGGRGGAARRPLSPARPSARGPPRHPRPRAPARGRGLPRLSDARGGRAPV